MENNELKLSKDGAKENVFTKEVKPISKGKYFLIGLGNTVLKALAWVADILVSVVLSLYQFLSMCVIGVGKFLYGIYRFFEKKVRQFIYNDWSGRLSFIAFGASSFKHKQYGNGIIFAVIEILFIVFMCLPTGGGHNLYMLFTLGVTETYEPEDPLEETIFGDNSITCLILGIFTLILVIAFVLVWIKNIEEGHKNYRIDNLIRYDNMFKANDDFARHIDEEAGNAFANKVNRFEFKKAHEEEINQYLSTIEDKKIRSYTKYLINETINCAYAQNHKLKKQNKKLANLEKQLANYISDREKELAIKTNNWAYDLENANEETIDHLKEQQTIGLDKFNNATLEGITKRQRKVDHQNNIIRESNKTYLNFCASENRRNLDQYGKYNRYYSDVAEMDSEIKFFENYKLFVNKYNDSLPLYDDKNKENIDKVGEITEAKNQKLVKTKEKFAQIRARKAELTAELKQLESDNAAQVRAVKSDSSLSDEEKVFKLEELKEVRIDFSTRLKGALFDLPTDKLIRSMEREENKETNHAFRRDKKYLKVNYTPETYAREAVIDMMILNYKIPYENAAYYASLMLVKDKETKQKRFLTDEELDERLMKLNEEKEAYVAKYDQKYNGRSETFGEQFKSLMNDKFHITILALPFIGILFFSILPLVFSILIAFTDFNVNNLPPKEMFDWIGLGNFVELFHPTSDKIKNISEVMGSTLGWTLIWAVFATFSNYFLGIIVALMINKDGIKFKGLWRTIFVVSIAIPAFISLMSVGIMLNKGGLLAEALNISFGASDTSPGAITTKTWIILVNIWVGIPYTMLSTTGILLNIPKDLYESARVDGAGPVTQFFKITMPYILFVTGPYLITTFIGNINNFNVIFFLSHGEPRYMNSVIGLGETDLMITAIYKIVTNQLEAEYGIASAIGILIFIVCAFFSIIMYNKSGSIQQEDQFQ